MFIYSYCNKPNISSKNFERSLKKYGYSGKYKILGKGEKWVNFMTKIKAYHKAVVGHVRGHTEGSVKCLQKDELILLVDCYDVIACKHVRYMSEANEEGKSKAKILVGSQIDCKEFNCLTLTNWWDLHNNYDNIPPSSKENKYANSGFILGTRDKLLHLLEFMLASTEVDDQMALCLYIEKYPHLVDIDTKNRIIATILPMDFNKYDIILNQVINKDTYTNPFFIHTPGAASDMYYRIDYFGIRLIPGYEVYPVDDKLDKLVNKVMNHNEYSIRSIGVGVLVLLIVYICVPRYRGNINIGAVLFILGLLWYTKRL